MIWDELTKTEKIREVINCPERLPTLSKFQLAKLWDLIDKEIGEQMIFFNEFHLAYPNNPQPISKFRNLQNATDAIEIIDHFIKSKKIIKEFASKGGKEKGSALYNEFKRVLKAEKMNLDDYSSDSNLAVALRSKSEKLGKLTNKTAKKYREDYLSEKKVGNA